MKKFIIALLALISVTGTVTYATTSSMIGKKVNSEAIVVLNDKELAKAIVIDGVSYLPVRTISNALNVDVGFNEGKVVLVDEEKRKILRLNLVNTQITFYQENIQTGTEQIERYTRYAEVAPEQKTQYNALITQAQVDINEYETLLRDLEKQRDDIITELAGK